MKSWLKRFFERNPNREVELTGYSPEWVLSVLSELGWNKGDSFWGSDLEILHFHKTEKEVFVLVETYFDPRISGAEEDVEEIWSGLEIN